MTIVNEHGVDLGWAVPLRTAWLALASTIRLPPAARLALDAADYQHPALIETGWVTADGEPSIPAGYLARCPQVIRA